MKPMDTAARCRAAKDWYLRGKKGHWAAAEAIGSTKPKPGVPEHGPSQTVLTQLVENCGTRAKSSVA